MEHLTYEGANQRRIEFFLLAAYTVFTSVMIMLCLDREWKAWVSLVLLACISSCWIVCVTKLRDYIFRSFYVTVIMQIGVIIYAINLEDIWNILPVFIAFIVSFGLYGNEIIILTTIISGVIIFGYHSFILKSFPCATVQDNINILVQMANIMFVQFIVYVWTKRNREGSKQLLGVIEQLEEVQGSKDDFLANVSHEIRTPINTICGISEIILNEDLPEKVKEDIMGIRQAGKNLTSVVRDILDFSELQSGKIELEEEEYNITSTINDVINMTFAKKKNKNIELIVDCAANIPSVLLGDEKKLRRIIMNLVDNAVKFTEEGFVSIEIGCRKETYGINLVITVKDTGIGMDAESMEKLFISFSQIDASRARQEGGVGLGLAISHQLARKMGAAITMKSKPGKGTTVKVVVPHKVVDETPIARLDGRENINVATYIDMEQFGMMEIRDEYTRNIIHLVENLNGKCHICRNFAELQRRFSKEKFSHVFISDMEYIHDKEYFDELVDKTKLIVVLDRIDEKKVTNPKITKIYKPYYIIPIVSVLNGLYDADSEGKKEYVRKFVTKNAKVLVVDDNKMNIRVIEGILADYKIDVTMAFSGKEALEKIASADYDFVFMDHMMPEMDGVETLQHIRSKVGSYYQWVPIVALTANAAAGTRESLLRQGFSDFLEKPIERSVLERVLKRNIPTEKIIYNDAHILESKSREEKQDITGLEEFLKTNDIDSSKGVVYCNGKDGYISVLKDYCREYKDSDNLAKKLYEKEDWKNYTIAVHGMKSSMRSIGAIRISDIAAALEKAGLNGNISYIREHHNELMEEYENLFENLCKCEYLCPEKNEEEASEVELEQLTEELFNQMISEMENAMYTLDANAILESLNKLQNYSYCGEPLKKSLVQAVRKVEMSDFMSAVDLVVKLKKRIEGKEE